VCLITPKSHARAPVQDGERVEEGRIASMSDIYILKSDPVLLAALVEDSERVAEEGEVDPSMAQAEGLQKVHDNLSCYTHLI